MLKFENKNYYMYDHLSFITTIYASVVIKTLLLATQVY